MGKNSKITFNCLILSLWFEISRKGASLADEHINACGMPFSWKIK